MRDLDLYTAMVDNFSRQLNNVMNASQLSPALIRQFTVDFVIEELLTFTIPPDARILDVDIVDERLVIHALCYTSDDIAGKRHFIVYGNESTFNPAGLKYVDTIYEQLHGGPEAIWHHVFELTTNPW
jgi:hypothetical protein